MKIEDKKTLYLLLNEYMSELLKQDDLNKQRLEENKKKGVHTYFEVLGVKAQFNHARCISNRLVTEIERHIQT